MDILLSWEKKEFVFDFKGKKIEVTMKLKSLDRNSMLLLSPFITSSATDIPTMVSNTLKMQSLAKTILKEHMKDFDGFTANGEEVTAELLSSSSVFTVLVDSIFAELIRMSNVYGVDEKKLDSLSGSQKTETSSQQLKE